MRIFVFSDSHGNCTPMLNVLKENVGCYDFVIHLGDYANDTKYIDRTIGVTPSLYVAGNNDYGSTLPATRTVELSGAKIFMCHGHTLNVKSSLDSLYYSALRDGCSVALFGHTHVPFSDNESGILICNPGTVGIASMGAYTYGILDIQDGKPNFKLKVIK